MNEIERKTLQRFGELSSIINNKFDDQYVLCNESNSIHYCDIFFSPKVNKQNFFIRLECILDSQIDHTPHNYKYGITFGICRDKNSKCVYRNSDTKRKIQELFIDYLKLSEEALNEIDMAPEWLFWVRLEVSTDLNEFVGDLIILRDKIIQDFGNII